MDWVVSEVAFVVTSVISQSVESGREGIKASLLCSNIFFLKLK